MVMVLSAARTGVSSAEDDIATAVTSRTIAVASSP